MNVKGHDKISGLPREVLVLIIEKIPHRPTLNALCIVSKLFNDVSHSFLYNKVTLQCLQKPKIDQIPLQKAASYCSHITSKHNLQHVRELEFKLDLDDGITKCWHTIGKEKDWTPRKGFKYAGDGALHDAFESQILAFCQRLPSGGLRSFSWDLASCLPGNFLGPDGYLPIYQSSLTQLSLGTGTDFVIHSGKANKYDLSKFENLRALSWMVPRNNSDFVTLRACLTTNATHLKSLSLDLGEREVLSVTDSKTFNLAGPRFPMLTSLSLSRSSLGRSEADRTRILRILPFSQLKTLKLRNCEGLASMLDRLADERTCSKLTCLEIFAYDVDDWTITNNLNVLPFLSSLSALEDVFLFLDDADWPGIANSICGHISSLKRVVLHRRELYLDDHYEYESEDTQKFIEELAILRIEGLRRLLTETKCEMIGMTCDLDDLRKALRSDAVKVACQLLHVRASGDQTFCGINKLEGFATWAFGPKGLQNLAVLAYGDFSFREGKQFLYCRNDVEVRGQPAFRRLIPRDADLWMWVQEHRDALKACPYAHSC